MSASELIHLDDIHRHPEVYEPCDDSFALADALYEDRESLLSLPHNLCLEIGCGSGYITAILAKILGHNARSYFLATDMNPNAAEVAASTLSCNGVIGDIVITDILDGLEKILHSSVDVLVCNPPYVPTPDEEVGVPGITSAWAGGFNGRKFIDRLLPISTRLLSQNGRFYLVTVLENNPDEIRSQMKTKGFASLIIKTRKTAEESLFVIKFWREPFLNSK